MNIKKHISLLLCICLFLSVLPIQVFATGTEGVTDEPIDEQFDDTNSLGELGGYLSGNTITASTLFAERKFTWAGGAGFAAERGNNLIDKLHGLNASIEGDNNVANGADRKIINRDGSITWIQDKYFSTASRSVDEAFDKTSGLYRYLDGDGKPMMLEVPSDQYDDAVKLMRSRIEAGKVPGVTDPEEAINLVRKGNLSYKQAVNIAKAGTVDSLKYDATNGTITAACAAGISFVIDFTCCVLNGADADDALKNAGLNGLKTGGVVFATYVISSQLAKTGLSNALVPTAEAIAKALGEDICQAIVLRTGVQTAGTSATKAAAQIISKELIADGVVLVVLTGIDVAELFRGRISTEELLKNLTVTIISIAAGTAGGYGGAALGTLIAPGAGSVIGGVVGSMLAGGITAWGAEKLIAPFYESDAEEMFAMISDEFTVLCGDYLINEEEGTRLADNLSAVLIGDVLKDMYASEDRQQFARDLIEPLFVEEVENRPAITTPTEEELRYSMKESMHGIVFVH